MQHAIQCNTALVSPMPPIATGRGLPAMVLSDAQIWINMAQQGGSAGMVSMVQSTWHMGGISMVQSTSSQHQLALTPHSTPRFQLRSPISDVCYLCLPNGARFVFTGCTCTHHHRQGYHCLPRSPRDRLVHESPGPHLAA